MAVSSGWQLAVGRRWQLAAVGGWRLVAVGGWWRWWLAVDGPLWRSLRAVLNKIKKEISVPKDRPTSLSFTSRSFANHRCPCSWRCSTMQDGCCCPPQQRGHVCSVHRSPINGFRLRGGPRRLCRLLRRAFPCEMSFFATLIACQRLCVRIASRLPSLLLPLLLDVLLLRQYSVRTIHRHPPCCRASIAPHPQHRPQLHRFNPQVLEYQCPYLCSQ